MIIHLLIKFHLLVLDQAARNNFPWNLTWQLAWALKSPSSNLCSTVNTAHWHSNLSVIYNKETNDFSFSCRTLMLPLTWLGISIWKKRAWRSVRSGRYTLTLIPPQWFGIPTNSVFHTFICPIGWYKIIFSVRQNETAAMLAQWSETT